MNASFRLSTIIPFALLLTWIVLHIPGVFYGTKDIPLHASYIGDEQSPINGALHILESQSLLGARNTTVLYYGPVFALAMIPAVVFDAGAKVIGGAVSVDPEEYKHLLLYDWGGIALWGRVIVVFVSVLSLVVAFRIFRDEGYSFRLSLIAPTLLATNFYFFEYSHFIKHWPFIILALLIQVWSITSIVRGGGKRWWFLQGVAVIFAAGISYISLLFTLMWLPVFFMWIRQRAWNRVVALIRLGLWVLAGVLTIIWWVPYGFARFLTFLGIGTPPGALGDAQNPLLLSTTSLEYYSSLLLINHLGIVFVGVLLVVAQTFVLRKWQFWTLLTPVIVNLALFLPAEHHEGRYMLISIVFSLILVAYLVGEYARSSQTKTILTIAIATLLLFNTIFHVVHIGKWIEVYARGPLEQNMIRELLQEPNDTVLFIGGYIVGAPHTKEAYNRYVEHSGKETINLYKELVQAPSPTTPLLDATYVYREEFDADPSIARQYDQVVYRYRPFEDALNDFDFIDEDITRIWWYEDFTPSYIFLQ